MLSAYASQLIQKSDRFELVSPIEAPWQNGIVVLRLPDHLNGVEMYHRLREDDDMLVSPVNHPQDLRVCLHFYNTEAEFDALMVRLDRYAVL